MIRMIGAMLLTIAVGLTSVFADELFDAEDAHQHFNTGLDLYFKKDYGGAIKEFEEAVQIDPENADAYYFMGYSYYKLRDMQKAMEVFDQAYEADVKYSPLRRMPESGASPAEE